MAKSSVKTNGYYSNYDNNDESHQKSWFSLENGHRDMRMIPVSIVVWCTAWADKNCLWVSAGLLIISLIIFGAYMSINRFHCQTLNYLCSEIQWKKVLKLLCLYSLVVSCAALCISLVIVAHELQESTDSARVNEAYHTKGKIVALARAHSSNKRGMDCQFDAQFHQIEDTQHAGVILPSQTQVVVYSTQKNCLIEPTAVYRVSGKIEPAQYGKIPVWLTITDSDDCAQVAAPQLFSRWINRMQNAFLEQCALLPQQARLLVPGLTLGITGADAAPGTSIENNSEDNAAGKIMQQEFKNLGIVHLLAVSGGHFALIGVLIARFLALLRIKPAVISVGVGCGYWLLASVMMPADSVTRALIMGILACVPAVIGRPSQSLNTLSWTIILVLLCQPTMAHSYGFALSCAAVWGIVMFSASLSAKCERRLPRSLSQAIAVTLSAQIATLPFQIMLTPAISLYTLLANVGVAPLVTFSTLCGLLSLALSWWWPFGGFICAWAAGVGTDGMARLAAMLNQFWGASLPISVTPWTGGIVFIVEIILGSSAWLVGKYQRQRSENREVSTESGK